MFVSPKPRLCIAGCHIVGAFHSSIHSKTSTYPTCSADANLVMSKAMGRDQREEPSNQTNLPIASSNCSETRWWTSRPRYHLAFATTWSYNVFAIICPSQVWSWRVWNKTHPIGKVHTPQNENTNRVKNPIKISMKYKAEGKTLAQTKEM